MNPLGEKLANTKDRNTDNVAADCLKRNARERQEEGITVTKEERQAGHTMEGSFSATEKSTIAPGNGKGRTRKEVSHHKDRSSYAKYKNP